MTAVVEIRRAKIADVDTLYELIYLYSEQKIVLPRTKESLIQQIFSFFVAVVDEKVVGCASLAILDRELAEIRSLVVDTSVKRMGIGKLLVEQIIQETKRLGINKLISLTYQVEFFQKCGFDVTVKDNMPQKVWKDCIHCPKLHHCDEIAMIIYTEDIVRA
ncbi:N-acetyltransferase [Bacillus benzoevorans]|uniref:N-acetyltransferase n=1 Tax=Bacillus benzoevorans TaxID=1456 RepID=UPI0016101FC5|nr:N-acetyltransferase [Bacillus benzoevorans]